MAFDFHMYRSTRDARTRYDAAQKANDELAALRALRDLAAAKAAYCDRDGCGSRG